MAGKNNTKPKLALAIIAKGDDREAELLDRLLGGPTADNIQEKNKNIDLTGVEGMAKHVDAIFVTITQKNKKCEEVAKKYGAHISHCEWDEQFDNARNFNWGQVPKEYEYICWYDCDDAVVNPYLHAGAVKLMKERGIDAAMSFYAYDHDEYGNCIVEHFKSRILKNDGTFRWSSAVHEDFAYERGITTHLFEDCYPIHLTDEVRIRESAERNLRISELELKRNPNDPRTYWNLANTYYMVHNYEGAKNIYLQFLKLSESEDERFLAWSRLAGIYANTGDVPNAIEAALEMVGLKPWYPDGYFQLGELYLKADKHKHAREMFEMGFKKKSPKGFLIVWNPLDYTFNPTKLYAIVLMELGLAQEAYKQILKCLKIRPKDKGLKQLKNSVGELARKDKKARQIHDKALKLTDKKEIKKLLEEVPEEMKYHPGICQIRNTYFIKKTTSGKDLIIYCSHTAQEWNPMVARKEGVGGSEEAIVQLSKKFKEAGYYVTVYCNTPKSQEFEFDGVKWLPFMAFNPRDRQDIAILWRHPAFVETGVNAKKIYIDMHDVIPPEEFTFGRLAQITKVMFKSDVQRKHYPHIPDDKCAVVPHGLDTEEFDSQRDEIKKDPYLLLNTSSPDRSLKTCLKAVKLAHSRLPEELKDKMKFTWHYGFNVWDTDFSDNTKMLKWKQDAIDSMNELKKMGIMTEESGGRVSQEEITRKYLSAGLLLYPSEFFEIGFIGGIKGMLGGAIPLTTDIFAQGEFCKGFKLHSEVDDKTWTRDIESGIDYGYQDISAIADKIVDYIKNVDKYESLRQEVVEHARQFTWDKTSEGWVKIFNE